MRMRGRIRIDPTRHGREFKGVGTPREEEELPFDARKVVNSRKKIALGLQDTDAIVAITTERLAEDIKQHPD